MRFQLPRVERENDWPNYKDKIKTIQTWLKSGVIKIEDSFKAEILW